MTFVDTGYRTELGISFYDREAELKVLDNLVNTYRVVVVYGPRNVGKSELVRYWSERQARYQVITFRADLVRSERAFEDLDRYLITAEERIRRVILSELMKLAFERLSLLRVVYAVYDAMRTMGMKVVLFLDEYHMLSGYETSRYRSRYEEALTDLEALVHWLAKRGDEYLKVVLTVSEGFIATSESLSRLHGYNTDFMLVEPMDEESFSALYEEYKRVKGCNVDYHVVYRVVGGSPGYLAELCQGKTAVVQFIKRSKSILESALSDVRNLLEIEQWRSTVGHLEPRKLIDLAYEVISEKGVSPIDQPLLYAIGQLLTTHNIVYPSYEETRVLFKPQIPLYRLLLEIAVDRDTTVLSIDVSEILRRIEIDCDKP